MIRRNLAFKKWLMPVMIVLMGQQEYASLILMSLLSVVVLVVVAVSK